MRGRATIAGFLLLAALAGCDDHARQPAASAGAAQEGGPVEIRVEYDAGPGGLLVMPEDIIDRIVSRGAWRAGGASVTAQAVKAAFDESCVFAEFTVDKGPRGIDVRDPQVQVVMHEGAPPTLTAIVRETVEGARFEKIDRGYRIRFRCALAVGGGDSPARYRCDVDARGEVLDPQRPEQQRFRATWIGPLAPDAPTATSMIDG